jgi:MFS family permease
LLVTTLWATGAYAVYTYIASLLSTAAGIEGPYLGAVLFVWGLSAAAGVFAGGTLTDRHGPEPVIVRALLFLALAFASLSASAMLLPKAAAAGPALVAIVVWGLSAWAFFPAQAGTADRHRRDQGRANRPVAQRLVHVSGLLARRCARFADPDLRRAFRARLGRWALRSRIAFALDPNHAHNGCSAGAGFSAINGFIAL